MTVQQAAQKLEISVSLAYSLVAEGRLPCRRIGRKGRRGKIIVSEEDLKAFLESVKIESAEIHGR